MNLICTTLACLYAAYPSATVKQSDSYLIFQQRDQITYCYKNRDYYSCNSQPLSRP